MIRLARTALAAAATLVLSAGVQASELNLYSSRHYDTDEALYAGFAKQTGIRINRIEAKEDELLERMKAEGANSPADLLITVDAGRLWRAQQMGLLQPVRSAHLEATIPAHLRDPEGHWFGFSKRARVLVYHTDRVKPAELTSYEVLAEPNWKGRVLVRSSTNVYNQSLVGSLIAHHGEAGAEAWARGLVANMARPPKGGDTDQIKAVAAGEGDVAIVNTYYFLRLKTSKKPADQAMVEKLAAVFPNQADRGTHVNISGAGVARHAPNRANAIRFLEYLASAEAQQYFAAGSLEFPVLGEAGVHPAVAALGSFKEDKLNAATYGRNNEAALKLMDRAGWK